MVRMQCLLGGSLSHSGFWIDMGWWRTAAAAALYQSADMHVVCLAITQILLVDAHPMHSSNSNSVVGQCGHFCCKDHIEYQVARYYRLPMWANDTFKSMAKGMCWVHGIVDLGDWAKEGEVKVAGWSKDAEKREGVCRIKQVQSRGHDRLYALPIINAWTMKHSLVTYADKWTHSHCSTFLYLLFNDVSLDPVPRN